MLHANQTNILARTLYWNCVWVCNKLHLLLLLRLLVVMTFFSLHSFAVLFMRPAKKKSAASPYISISISFAQVKIKSSVLLLKRCPHHSTMFYSIVCERFSNLLFKTRTHLHIFHTCTSYQWVFYCTICCARSTVFFFLDTGDLWWTPFLWLWASYEWAVAFA